jgi:uncharacterized membrane protein (UPF0127 family)
MKWLAAAGVLAALFFCSLPGFAKVRYATKPCANPDLPRAIIDGSPVVDGHAPLRTIDVTAKKATLTLAVADNAQQRELGLMCVTALREHAGMIFVFPKASDWQFWMKNTLVPLDMVWVEADGKVSSVAADVPESALSTPDDKVARRTGHGGFVIELNAGEASRDGIAAGQHLALPTLTANE